MLSLDFNLSLANFIYYNINNNLYYFGVFNLSQQKNCIIFGAGIIGLTTAYALYKQGFKVTVVEKESAAGLGTSQYNGGLLAYSYMEVLGHHGILKEILPLILGKVPFVNVSRTFSTYHWLSQVLLQSRSKKYNKNQSDLLRLSLLSKEKMELLLKEVPMDFSYKPTGRLSLCYQDNELKEGFHDEKLIEGSGLHLKFLDRKGALEKLNIKDFNSEGIMGGFFSPDEAVGDCFAFIENLTDFLKNKGVTFLYETSITEIKTTKNRIESVITSKNTLSADSYIICAGMGTNGILNLLDLSIPLHPIKGYAMTVPNNVNLQICVLDNKRKVIFTPLGDKIRIAGFADIGDYSQEPKKNRVDFFKSLALNAIPSLDLENVTVHSRLRPCLPSSVPMTNKFRYDNLYVNTGHGFLGWTLAMGSAYKIASIIDS